MLIVYKSCLHNSMQTRKIPHRSSIEVIFFVLYYKRNIKHFFPYRYSVISTLVEMGKTRNCVETVRRQRDVHQHG